MKTEKCKQRNQVAPVLSLGDHTYRHKKQLKRKSIKKENINKNRKDSLSFSDGNG